MSEKNVKISIDPVTRIEGHLKAEVKVENGVVTDAWMSGGMFRGFENILIGRDPRDATQIVQRICGVCPTAHSTASCLALDDAFGVKLTTNGRVTRNLIFGANYLQSHILHFYHLAALDYVAGPDVAPFVPRYEKSDLRLTPELNKVAVDQYLEALNVRLVAHEMVALFGGKMPHVSGQVVGGTTEIPSQQKLDEYTKRFKLVRKFIEETYVPTVYVIGKAYADLLKVGDGYKNVISFGVFPMDDSGKETLLKPGVYINGKDVAFDPAKIKEYAKYSWFEDSCSNLHPSQGKTLPKLGKPGAYSFIKAPRYDGHPVEVGPLARMWVSNPELSPMGKKQLKDLFGINANRFRDLGDLAFSVMGRHVARAEETYLVAKAIEERWLKEVKPGKETFVAASIPDSAEGIGFTEAPRGSLLHYVNIKDKKIANYQIVSATLWNANPRDDMGKRGPMEQALIGTPVPDAKNPVNVGRVIRAYDP
ncbi:Ni,Fe-hydrogenase I large subunit [Desulfocurvibacter africanus PCS]|uniref:Periplasmic [NiFe] hydrogenase large subunit n=2 Tax=Desulfocurvibacter africanus TaxID=873 RepID=M5Q2T2_DESAF|nr:Ni,Fe-hydrogenase I large subunit [Desulfocurvibacter africanus PCS]